MSVAIYDQFLLVGQRHGAAQLWSLRKRSLAYTLQGDAKSLTVKSVAISSTYAMIASGRSRMYRTGQANSKELLQRSTAFVFSLADGRLTHTLLHGAMIGWDGLSVSETHAVTSGEDHVVKLWDVESGNLLYSLPADEARSPGVALAPSCLFLASVRQVTVHSLSDGSVEKTLNIPSIPKKLGENTPLRYPRLVADDTYVVAASEHRSATVWNILDGRELCTVEDDVGRYSDFHPAIAGNCLVLGVGKVFKLYDLSVHQGYKRSISESLGVSLGYLISNFSSDATKATGKADPNFHELAPAFAFGEDALGASKVCPRDGRLGCALVDVLPSGKATHFLSWVWSYRVSTVVQALQTWVKDGEVRILQERSKEGSDNLEETFKSRLRSIGRVLVLLDDWSTPKYLTRVWCIFETYVSLREELPYTLILPSESAETLHSALQRGMHMEVTREWNQIDVAKAEASRPVDAERVKEIICRTSSFDEVNTLVRSHLVGWFKRQFEAFLEKSILEGVPACPESVACSSCASKDEEIKGLRKALAEKDAEITEKDAEIERLKAVIRSLPAGSAVAAANAMAH